MEISCTSFPLNLTMLPSHNFATISIHSLISWYNIEFLTSQGRAFLQGKLSQISVIVCGYNLTLNDHRKRCACVSELAEESAITQHHV